MPTVIAILQTAMDLW